LQFNENGNWKFEELNKLEKRIDLKEEKDNLEVLLFSISEKQRRLKELCLLLGESSIALN
jgi:hypothetical protein